MEGQERDLPPITNSTDQWLALIYDELTAQRGAEAPPDADPSVVRVKEPRQFFKKRGKK